MNQPHAAAAIAAPPPVTLGDILPPQNVELDAALGSRKKLLQRLAELAANYTGLGQAAIFKTINERERLGSTGIGEGIALPHGRIDSLSEPLLVVIRLEYPINYDTPDEQPVWLAVCLLVPANAAESHLKLLAQLASKFQQPPFLQGIRIAQTSQELRQQFLRG